MSLSLGPYHDTLNECEEEYLINISLFVIFTGVVTAQMLDEFSSSVFGLNDPFDKVTDRKVMEKVRKFSNKQGESEEKGWGYCLNGNVTLIKVQENALLSLKMTLFIWNLSIKGGGVGFGFD